MKKFNQLTFLFFLFSICLLNSSIIVAYEIDIQITNPQQDEEVGHQELVRGTISAHDVQVYVLVHPMATNLWWVQRLPSSINKDGSWQTLCYFGTKNQGIGEYFEVIAIVTAEELEEGQTLKALPADSVRSDMVTVKRIH